MAEFTVNLTEDEGYGLNWPGNKVTVLRRTVDFTETANQLIQTGVMSIFKVPADCVVLSFGIKVTTADTDVTDIDLGYYTETAAGVITVVDVDAYQDGISLAATGYVANDVDAANNTGGAAALKPIAANSVLTLVNNDANTIDEAVVEFYAIVMDISKPTGTTPGASDSYTT